MYSSRRPLTYLLIGTFIFAPISVTFGEIFFYLALLLGLLSKDWVKNITQLKKHPIFYPIIAVIAIVFIGLIYSPVPLHLKVHVFTKYIWLIALPFLLISVSPDIFERYAIPAFLFQTAVILLLSYLKLAHLFHTKWDYSSVFRDHITQNILFAMALFITLYRTINSTTGRWFYAIFSLALLINMVFFSASRIGYVAACLVIFFISCKKLGIKQSLLPSILIFALILTSAYFASPLFKQGVHRAYQNTAHFFTHKKNASKTSSGIRLRDYKRMAWAIKQKPLLGYGIGGITQAMKDYDQVHKKIPQSYYNPLTDSDYNNIILQFGVIGFAVFLIFFISLLRQSKHLPSEKRDLIQMLILLTAILGTVDTLTTNGSIRMVLMLFIVLCYARCKTHHKVDS